MKYFVIFLVLTGFVALIPQAFACSCSNWDIEDDYKEKDRVIFSGKVTDIKEQQRSFLVTFEIEQSWKNIPDDVNNIDIMTAQNSASCGYGFADQQSYLVVAYGVWNQTPNVSMCSSTFLLDSADEQISFLKKQTKNIVDGDSVHMSPLKQYNSGIPLEEIQCKDNLTLIQKYDGLPACVLYHTGVKLLERVWATCDDEISHGLRGHPCGVRSSPGISSDNYEIDKKLKGDES